MRTHMLAAVAAAALFASSAPAFAQNPLGSLFACNNPGKKDRTGAIVGGLAGALVGSQVSKNERALGAIVGAGLGAAAGNYFGCRMNNDGRNRAEGAVRTALETGRSQTWSDPSSGASGRVEIISDGRDRPGSYGPPMDVRDLRYARGVERIYTLQPAAPTYVSRGRINMRAAPGTSARVIDQLRPGEEIRVAGASNGWLAVLEEGRIEGYVAASTVRPAGGGYADNRGCRTVEQTISQRGYPNETNRFNACRDTRGEWQIQPV